MQQIGLRDFRFGSIAEIRRRPINVRFTPKSGHRNSVVECPLCAKSGHLPRLWKMSHAPSGTFTGERMRTEQLTWHCDGTTIELGADWSGQGLLAFVVARTKLDFDAA